MDRARSFCSRSTPDTDAQGENRGNGEQPAGLHGWLLHGIEAEPDRRRRLRPSLPTIPGATNRRRAIIRWRLPPPKTFRRPAKRTPTANRSPSRGIRESHPRIRYATPPTTTKCGDRAGRGPRGPGWLRRQPFKGYSAAFPLNRSTVADASYLTISLLSSSTGVITCSNLRSSLLAIATHLLTSFAGWLGALGAVVPAGAGTSSHPPPKALTKTTVATMRWPTICVAVR
jgi:hypothetical protein